ncbi:hypothetical protein HDU92_004101 [Lobulomyces angularis]|nr:hypothetical protein HDU92_004101 [Lobulomyces angularis]
MKVKKEKKDKKKNSIINEEKLEISELKSSHKHKKIKLEKTKRLNVTDTLEVNNSKINKKNFNTEKNDIEIINLKIKPEVKNKKIKANFTTINSTLFLTIPPIYSLNIKDGITNFLDKLLNRYVDKVKGVLVSYSNLKLLQNAAKIINESPFLNFKIQLDLFVFNPNIGDVLVGIVNKVSQDHVGVLVHGVFNASIPKSNLNDAYFTLENNSWKFEKIHTIKPGTCLKFVTEKLITHNEILTITGTRVSVITNVNTEDLDNINNS